MSAPLVPAVPSAPAGWMPDQADLDLWVQQPFRFLSSPTVFRAQQQTAYTVNGWTVVPLTTQLEDTWSGWSDDGTSRQPAHSWMCPEGCGGWYEASISAFTGSQGSAAGDAVRASLYLNGVAWAQGGETWAPSGADAGTSGAVAVPLLPGDYVQLYAWSPVSVAAPTTAGMWASLEITWISS